MVDNEIWSLPDGTILYNVHPPERCEGSPCWIHHPTNHHMVDWPMIRRESGLLERQCKHGIGHPDPDSLWFMKNILHIEGYGVHGCCGCCRA
jgi:hypothetical protein